MRTGRYYSFYSVLKSFFSVYSIPRLVLDISSALKKILEYANVACDVFSSKCILYVLEKTICEKLALSLV